MKMIILKIESKKIIEKMKMYIIRMIATMISLFFNF
jgi:hypothetical protein